MRLPTDKQRDVLLGCAREVGAPITVHGAARAVASSCVRRGWLREGFEDLSSRTKTYHLTHLGLTILDALARAAPSATDLCTHVDSSDCPVHGDGQCLPSDVHDWQTSALKAFSRSGVAVTCSCGGVDGQHGRHCVAGKVP